MKALGHAFVLVLVAALCAGAQVTPYARVTPETGEVGLAMTLAVAVEGVAGSDCELIAAPKVANARLTRTGGPSTQDITQSVNGRVRRSLTTTWYFELVPSEPGELVVPPFDFNCRGETVRTAPLVVPVAEARAELQDVVRLSVEVDTDEVWVGQVVEVVVRASVLEDAFDLIPRGTGFEIEYPWLDEEPALAPMDPPMPDCDNVLGLAVNEGSRQLPTCAWRDISGERPRIVYEQVVPMLAARAGSLRLATSRFSVRLVVQQASNRGIFALLGNRQPARVIVKDAEAEGPRLTVRPTPATGRPPGFTNAVGRFRLDGRAEPDTLRVGESCLLTLSLYLESPREPTSGNLDLVEWPEFEALYDDFRIFGKEERTTQRLRVLELEISPKNDRVSEVPALSFAYFDPVAEAYASLDVGPFPLDVEPGGGEGLAELSTPEEMLNDLETIRETLPAPAPASLPPWTWPGAALALLLVVEVWQRRARWREHNPAAVARRGAYRALVVAVGRADDAPTVAAAFSKYLSARLGGPDAGLTAEEAAARIPDRELAEDLTAIVNGWEEVYLAGGDLDLTTIRAQARRLADRLEVMKS